MSQLRKDRDAAQSRAEKAERGLESLGYDKGQEDGLAADREKEEKAVEGLREVWKPLVAHHLHFAPFFSFFFVCCILFGGGASAAVDVVCVGGAGAIFQRTVKQ